MFRRKPDLFWAALVAIVTFIATAIASLKSPAWVGASLAAAGFTAPIAVILLGVIFCGLRFVRNRWIPPLAFYAGTTVLLIEAYRNVHSLPHVYLAIMWVSFGMPIAIVTPFIVARPTPAAPSCRKCSYNLTGNISGLCPECGTPVSQAKSGAVAPQLRAQS